MRSRATIPVAQTSVSTQRNETEVRIAAISSSRQRWWSRHSITQPFFCAFCASVSAPFWKPMSEIESVSPFPGDAAAREKSAINFPTELQIVNTPSLPYFIRWMASAPTASRSLCVRWTTCAVREAMAEERLFSSSVRGGCGIHILLGMAGDKEEVPKCIRAPLGKHIIY